MKLLEVTYAQGNYGGAAVDGESVRFVVHAAGVFVGQAEILDDIRFVAVEIVFHA